MMSILDNLNENVKTQYEDGFEQEGVKLLLNENIDERLISLKLANSCITDDKLHEIMQYAGEDEF